MKLRFKIFSVIVILCILIGSGIVLASNGQSWKDITLDDKTVCLKVYTLENGRL